MPGNGTSDGWISLFDGETLDGWRASENPGTFRVEDGAIVVDGPRSHLFYVGPVMNHNFRNFEWTADVMTTPGSNSGMYFHTEYQEQGWPSKGYEVQVNNSHSDWRRTGSLYAIDDVREQLMPDNEWFTQRIIVEGNRVQVFVNGTRVVDYTEPENPERPRDMAGRVLSSGTVALQGHDPRAGSISRTSSFVPFHSRGPSYRPFGLRDGRNPYLRSEVWREDQTALLTSRSVGRAESPLVPRRRLTAPWLSQPGRHPGSSRCRSRPPKPRSPPANGRKPFSHPTDPAVRSRCPRSAWVGQGVAAMDRKP